MKIHRELEERLLLAVDQAVDPEALRQDLDRFLPNATIVLSERVETARILRRGSNFRIEFGRAFFERELGEPQDLLFVFLHECFHHVLGHLSGRKEPRDPLRRQAENIAADILVNRALCERFFPRGVGLLERLYEPSHPVAVLLRPPQHGPSQRPPAGFRRPIEKAGFSPKVIEKSWAVMQLGWFGRTPFQGLIEHVLDLLRLLGRSVTVLLLGDHSQRGQVSGLPWDEMGEPGPPGFSEALEEEELEEPVRPAVHLGVAQAVRAALDLDPNNPRRSTLCTPITSPLFGPGRRDYPFLAMGYWPTLFHGPRIEQATEDQRARVYVDVSGSFDAYIPQVYGFLLALADEVGPSVYLFSNQVAEVSIAEMAKGVRRTTRGTDFDCVVEHALQHRFRRIVVITDGIGDLSDANRAAFVSSGASLYLVLLEFPPEAAEHLSPLFGLARGVWQLG